MRFVCQSLLKRELTINFFTKQCNLIFLQISKPICFNDHFVCFLDSFSKTFCFSNSASNSSIVGKLLFRSFGNEFKRSISYPATPIGLLERRKAYSTIRSFFVLHNNKPIVGLSNSDLIKSSIADK